MIGIYKITNNINGHSYVGQSTNILKRWANEKSAAFNKNWDSYNYPLSKAFRKYGIQNFTFEIIEECKNDELNEKENYWINFYNCEYNQTSGGDYQVHGKLTFTEVKKIQEILINDIDGCVRHTDLAKEFNVSPDTIQAINAGRAWVNSELKYPLHLSKYDKRREREINYCKDCGKIIYRKSIRCSECNFLKQKNESKILDKITREELKEKIRNLPFTAIGKEFGVSDNAIKKWCVFYGLPKTKKEINSFTDEEWIRI